MSDIPKLEPHWSETYDNNLQQALQRMGPDLLDCVTVEDGHGEHSNFVDLYDPRQAKRSDDIYRDTPHSPSNRRRRWISPNPTIEDGEMIDSEDKLRQLMDPTSRMIEGQAMAVGRGVDEDIHAGAIGYAYEGKHAAGATPIALPAGNQIAAAVGTTTGLNPVKIEKVLELMRQSHIKTDREQITVLCGAQQLSNLAAFTEFTSRDFGDNNYYQTGQIGNKLGVRIKNYEGLAKVGNDRKVVVIVKRLVVAKFWVRPRGKVSPRPDKRDIPHAWYEAKLGVGRVEEAGVYTIDCTES